MMQTNDGGPAMTLEQARRVMVRTLATDPKDRPRYGDWQVAGATIAKHYRDHPEQLKPVFTTDAKPRAKTSQEVVADLAREYRASRTKDQPPAYVPFERPQEFEREEARGVDLGREVGATIQRTGWPNEVGGDLVQVLPGDASSYYVAIDYNTGKAALFRYRQPQIDPGRVGNSRGTLTTTMDRGPAYYQRLARQANARRELAGVQLKAMNEANRKAWEGRRG
jgi:hypothetical protein